MMRCGAVRFGAVRSIVVLRVGTWYGGTMVRYRDQEGRGCVRSASDRTPRGLMRGERIGRGGSVGQVEEWSESDGVMMVGG
jgi:hypothetical protein